MAKKIVLTGGLDLQGIQKLIFGELDHYLGKYLQFFPILQEAIESGVLKISMDVRVESVSGITTIEKECTPEENCGFASITRELLTLCNSIFLKPGENSAGQKNLLPEEEKLMDAIFTATNIKQKEILSRPISSLDLSVRARRCVRSYQLETVGDLTKRSAEDLLEVKNFGNTCLCEVREKLATLGLKLVGE